MSESRQAKELREKTKNATMISHITTAMDLSGVSLDKDVLLKNIDELHKLATKVMDGDEVDWSKFTSHQEGQVTALNMTIDSLLEGSKEVQVLREYSTPGIIDGEVVTKYLVIIPHHLIEETTYVVEENDREQKSLNANTLSYILNTLTEKGQLVAAEAYNDKQKGKYAVIEGSSRRASCMLGKRAFRMWVTDTVPSKEAAEYISEVGNASKAFSSYEIGKKIIRFSNKFPDASREAIAEQFKMKMGRVSLFINAVEIVPIEAYLRFPSVTSVSREVIEKLVPIFRRFHNKDKKNGNGDFTKRLLDSIKAIDLDGMNDSEVLEEVILTADNILPKVKTVAVSNWVNVGNSKYLSDINESEKSVTLKLQNVDQTVLDKYKRFLESL
ncbi:hypothetical protein A1QO_00575 [Vibrio genomosp. F10 str. ZF-129]|uniref:Chromosome partitioning protein ParB n=1 Tax=Vibrio genomosp. F10 str. ZF-129 TaxID=1187848 RepID=A0A1E5BG90_9VIBR|nr:hypothetical protein [Vibrio genomosp. F10]OEE35286.1 hypothetical protein A1QO_00575 [Vibrio genomosp. F10 str. ZF-129]